MTVKTLQVAGIGHALVDIIAHSAEATLAAFSLIKGTMRLTSPEEASALYAAMGPAVEVSGGSAANTCAGVASFGGRAGFMGKLGLDQFAEVFAHDIRAAGVAFETSNTPTDTPTGRCLILVTPDGERTMNTNLGAAAEFAEADLNRDMIEAAQILFMEGYLFDPVPARAAFFKAAEYARASGTKVALTLSDPFVATRHRDDLLRFMRSGVDLVFANEKEALALHDTASLDDAMAALRAACPLAVVTRSEKGSLVLAGDRTVEIAPEPVGQVVDATGAGDLYAAGFMFGLTSGYPLELCGRLGSLAAAEIIGQVGPRPIRSLAELARNRGLLREAA
jgi:sugar/nucleoside kinase (ribokinase family)